MRRDDITSLIGLPIILFFFYVNSQNICPSDWFESECNYKCRCTDDKCDPSGECADQYTCQGGWFGPACQYVDMAYNKSQIFNVTDGNDNTCANSTGLSKLFVSLEQSFIFTWLRVHVTDKVSDALGMLQMTLSHNKTDVKCPDLKTHAVDKQTFDMHCISEDQINAVTLNGDAVAGLCSVYVSGGRNVALKQKAEQGGSYFTIEAGVKTFYEPWLAVDGDNRQFFNLGSCSHTSTAPYWSLRLSKPRSVHRYVIYNRADSGLNQLSGFKLESFDQLNKSVFVYEDSSTQGSLTYTVIHTPRSIQTLALTLNKSDNSLHFCEFEAYGDSICDNRSFGFECEQSCHCLNGKACFVSTGGCPVCPAGFIGEDCQTTCKVGMFGTDCNMTCNEHCKPTGDPNLTSCNASTGECLKGCQRGFTGSRCLDSCEVGMFGEDCSMTCSEHCNPTGDPNMTSCDVTTGECLKGCQPGFTGNRYSECCTVGMFGEDCNQMCSKHCQPTGDPNLPSCNASTGECLKGCQPGFSGNGCLDTAAGAAAGAAARDDTGMFSLEIVIGMCVLLALLLLLSYCFYPRKKPIPKGELTAAEAHLSASPEGL